MLFRIDNTIVSLSLNQGINVSARGPEHFYYCEVEEFIKNESSPVIVEGYYFSSRPEPYITENFVLPIQFYFDFQISVFKVVEGYGLTKIFTHRFNDTSKVVKFVLETENVNEAKIWLDCILEYCQVHSCDKIIQSKFDFINNHSNPYLKTKEIEPYKTYRLGRFPKNSTDWRTIDPRKEGLIWYGNWKTFWSYEHPRCWKGLTSKEIADDILGL